MIIILKRNHSGGVYSLAQLMKISFKKYFSVIFLAFLYLLGIGCAKVDGTLIAEKEMADVLKRSEVITPTPASGADSLLPEDVTKASREGKRFNISVTNLPADIFFLSLVSDAKVNVVTDPEIEGNISLELKNVTVDEVLSVVRDVYGYEFSFDNGVYIIYSRKIRTEIFDVDYLNVLRDGSTETSVAIGSIKANDDSSGVATEQGAGSENNSTNTSGTQITTKTKTDFWQDLERTLNMIVGSKGDRAVIVNPHASIVVVKALPKELSRVRRFLDRAQLNVKRQIILETKILEVTLSDGYESGIHWEKLGHALTYTHNVSKFGSGPSILEAAPNGDLFSSIVAVNDIFSVLSFLETQGSVQVLSSPRVSTVNNQKAMIRVGTDEFFVTGVKSNTTASAATTTTSPEVELTSFFSGISLDVTPQISAEGDVILHVHPLVSAVEDQQKTFTIGNEKYDLPLALRDIRENDSVVRARSGEVVVLGGLMQEVINQQDGKRPLLGDIPIVNLFFKTKSNKKLKKELVILMRPIVIDAKSIESGLEQATRRFQSLGQELDANVRHFENKDGPYHLPE